MLFNQIVRFLLMSQRISASRNEIDFVKLQWRVKTLCSGA